MNTFKLVLNFSDEATANEVKWVDILYAIRSVECEAQIPPTTVQFRKPTPKPVPSAPRTSMANAMSANQQQRIEKDFLGYYREYVAGGNIDENGRSLTFEEFKRVTPRSIKIWSEDHIQAIADAEHLPLVAEYPNRVILPTDDPNLFASGTPSAAKELAETISKTQREKAQKKEDEKRDEEKKKEEEVQKKKELTSLT